MVDFAASLLECDASVQEAQLSRSCIATGRSLDWMTRKDYFVLAVWVKLRQVRSGIRYASWRIIAPTNDLRAVALQVLRRCLGYVGGPHTDNAEAQRNQKPRHPAANRP